MDDRDVIRIQPLPARQVIQQLGCGQRRIEQGGIDPVRLKQAQQQIDVLGLDRIEVIDDELFAVQLGAAVDESLDVAGKQIAAKRSRAEYPLRLPLLEDVDRGDRGLELEERKRMMRGERLGGSPSRDGDRERGKHHDTGPGLEFSNDGSLARSQLL